MYFNLSNITFHNFNRTIDRQNMTYTYLYLNFNIYYAIISLLIIASTITNAWLLAAILTSKKMRVKFRNQLLSMVLFNFLLQTLVCNITELHTTHQNFELGNFLHCSVSTFSALSGMIIDSTSNLSLSLFLLQFMMTFLDFDVINASLSNLRPWFVKLWTVVICAGPWVFNTIAMTTISYQLHNKRFRPHPEHCLYLTQETMEAIKPIFHYLPLCIDLLFLVTVAVNFCRLRCRRGGGLDNRDLETVLISRQTDVYNELVFYVIISLIWIILPILNEIWIYLPKMSIEKTFTYLQLTWALAELRILLIPLMCLMLPEIRERIKTWGPWYRPVPGINLTVKYKQNQTDEN